MDLTFDQKYKAIVDRDSSYEGIFIVAVKTTKIFCRPVCTARKPKPENVTFFDTPKEALLHGYRPCKVCHPLEPAGETPAGIKEIIQEFHNKPYLRLRDSDLKSRGMEPSHVRRWFKKNHNMTFQSYQRMLRINGAYKNIIDGEQITHAAFNAGFDSLSGFNTRFQSVIGGAPTRSADKSIINIIRFTTPLGPMFACAAEEGVCLLEFTDRRMLETEFDDLRKRLNAEILPGSNPHLALLQKEIEEYFEGTRKTFTVQLYTPGSPFRQAVWNSLLNIPYGKTRSYKQQAILMGRPEAIRAVASANGHNRISIIIPCHRVIGENGALVGYGGGLPRKKWLLEHEQKNA